MSNVFKSFLADCKIAILNGNLDQALVNYEYISVLADNDQTKTIVHDLGNRIQHLIFDQHEQDAGR